MNDLLITERLTLRRPAPKDWENVRPFFMSERSVGIGGPYSLGAAWRHFASELGHWEILGYGMWSVTVTGGDDTALGFVGPWVPADWPETEIGWLIFDPKVEGTGYAFEAAQAAVRHAWDVLKWDTIVSYIAHDNSRSIKLAKRLGAELDPEAPQPHPDKPCLVYRHPRSEALASESQS